MTPKPRNGSSRGWRAIRRRVLVRDNHTCQIRRPGCTGHATTVDHIQPHSLGGTDTMDNLRAACAYCNYSRGNGQRTTARPRRRPQQPAAALAFFNPHHKLSDKNTALGG